jgi:hypothetical protein
VPPATAGTGLRGPGRTSRPSRTAARQQRSQLQARSTAAATLRSRPLRLERPPLQPDGHRPPATTPRSPTHRRSSPAGRIRTGLGRADTRPFCGADVTSRRRPNRGPVGAPAGVDAQQQSVLVHVALRLRRSRSTITPAFPNSRSLSQAVRHVGAVSSAALVWPDTGRSSGPVSGGAVVRTLSVIPGGGREGVSGFVR